MIDDNLAYEGEKGRSSRAVSTTHGVIQSIKKFIKKDSVKSLMSKEGSAEISWSRCSHRQKKRCRNLEVANDSELSLKSYDVRAVESWLHRHTAHPGWQEVAIREAERTSVMQLIEASIDEMGSIMVQKRIEARPGMKSGETVKVCCQPGGRKE